MQKGICRLCGVYKELSFEHIPPKKAFNNYPLVFKTISDLLNERSYTKYRRGMGDYSLCEDCNSRTGDWYAEAFIEWVKQGLEWYNKVGERGLLFLPYYIKPLNVIKQVLVMAIAMSNVEALPYHLELRKMLLNREQKYIPPKYQVHVYFNTGGQPRFTSGTSILRKGLGDPVYIEAEIALPPFGYTVTKPQKEYDSLSRNDELCDITWFSDYAYNEWTPIQLRMPAKETHQPLPLDYRSREQIEEDYNRNIAK